MNALELEKDKDAKNIFRLKTEMDDNTIKSIKNIFKL